MRPPVRLLPPRCQKVLTVHEANHSKKPNWSSLKSRTCLVPSPLYTHVPPQMSDQHTLSPSEHWSFHSSVEIGPQWSSGSCGKCRCSPHPWQTQFCGSCHPCHGSAIAPKHTDFRDTAHRFEKESQSWVGAENSSFICVHIDKGSENRSVRTRASTPALVPLFAVHCLCRPMKISLPL